MKLVSYREKNKVEAFRIGVLDGENVHDLQKVHQVYLEKQREGEKDILPADPNQFFALGNSVIEKAREAYDYLLKNQLLSSSILRSDVILGTPISRPGKIICVGQNYAKHAAEMGSDVPDYPVLFSKFANTLIGPEDAIEKPAITNRLDYEVELVVVIGKEAKNIKEADAFDYIAGYTIGNDTSARDLQKRTAQWLQGKTLDRTTPIGPWIIPHADIGEVANLSIKSFVNGEVRQSSNTSDLLFSIPYLLEFISQLMTLEPGDLIMTGTPEGVGHAMNPQGFVNEGDSVLLEIENIGQMENKIVSESIS